MCAVRSVRMGTVLPERYRTLLGAKRAAGRRNRAEGWRAEGLRDGWGAVYVGR